MIDNRDIKHKTTIFITHVNLWRHNDMIGEKIDGYFLFCALLVSILLTSQDLFDGFLLMQETALYFKFLL